MSLFSVLLCRYMKVAIASAQKRDRRLESRSVAPVLLVATLASRSATPFDEGE